MEDAEFKFWLDEFEENWFNKFELRTKYENIFIKYLFARS